MTIINGPFQARRCPFMLAGFALSISWREHETAVILDQYSRLLCFYSALLKTPKCFRHILCRISVGCGSYSCRFWTVLFCSADLKLGASCSWVSFVFSLFVLPLFPSDINFPVPMTTAAWQPLSLQLHALHFEEATGATRAAACVFFLPFAYFAYFFFPLIF